MPTSGPNLQHAKESKEAELKRLRKKLKVALKFEKASEAGKPFQSLNTWSVICYA